jgi:hypothetical protein
MDRKTSLKILATAAIAAITVRPSTATAGKVGKKAKKRCQAQRDQCLAFLQNSFCRRRRLAVAAEGLPEEEIDPECVAFYTPCCDSFGSCDAASGFPCFRREQPLQDTR